MSPKARSKKVEPRPEMIDAVAEIVNRFTRPHHVQIEEAMRAELAEHRVTWDEYQMGWAKAVKERKP